MVERDLLYAYQGLTDTTKGEESVEDHLPTSITQGASNSHSDEDMGNKIKVLDQRVQTLIRTYPEVFGELPPRASCDKLVQMDLKLKPEFLGHKIRRRPYPAPKEQAEEIEPQIQECIDAGLVLEYKHGDYPQHCSPCFLVAKPGSTVKRLVVDYGELNRKTPNHSGSIPNMESTLEKIASCRYKTKMDKRSGFWQVDLTPNAQELLAFITPHGRVFKWKVMPFGVANAPALFQVLMNKILSILRSRPKVQELISRGPQMEAHIDDVCLGTNTQEDHLILLGEFFAEGTLHQQQAAGEAQQTHSVEITRKPSGSKRQTVSAYRQQPRAVHPVRRDQSYISKMDTKKEDTDVRTAPEAPAMPAPGEPGPGPRAVPWEPLHGPVEVAEDSMEGLQSAFRALSVEEVDTHPVNRKREREKDAGEGIADEGADRGHNATNDPTFEGAPSASGLHASPSPITTTLPTPDPAAATSTPITNPPMAEGIGFTGMPTYPAYGVNPPTTAFPEATTTSEPVTSSSAPQWYAADYHHPLPATGAYVDVPGYATLSGSRRGPESCRSRSRGSEDPPTGP